VDAIERCGNTEGAELAVLEELGECLRRQGGRADTASTREAMFRRAFHDGALSAAAGKHLVRAGMLSARQAKVLEKPDIARVLAGRQPAYRSITASWCALADGSSKGTIELRCHGFECMRACLTRSFEATIRVEAWGLVLVGATESVGDDGHCGCCK
jgi:hypothetical protein